MQNKILQISFLLLYIVCGLPFTLHAQSVYQAHTTVDFISDVKSIEPGTSFWIGLRMKMDPDWHVYWRNPGDSGLAPTITWKLPEGASAGPIQWPFPSRINVGPLTSYGFEHEIIFWSEIKTGQNLSAETFNVEAKVNWLTCKVDCIPGQAELFLPLPVGPGKKNEEFSQRLEQDRLTWPIQESVWNIRAEQDKNNFKFILSSDNPQLTLQNVFFFPYKETLILHPAAQELQAENGKYTLTIPKSNLITKEVIELEGILVNELPWDGSGHRSLEIKRPLETAMASKESGSMTLVVACWFAFLGGIILNFMPCVLPVLSLKIIGLVKTVHDRRKMFLSGVMFTLGVLVSFWMLAGLLFILQSAGQQLGWGFQFQSPIFVALMSGVLFILALNLFGIFEIGAISVSAGHLPTSGYSGSFMSGVLATLLATPCTAPFMGTALSFAITQPTVISLMVFTCLGLGMAAPFLLLACFPRLLSFLPKPGTWMYVLKNIFGTVLLLCVVWLAWVLNLQKGPFAIVVLMIGLALMGIGAVAGGLFQRQGKQLGFLLVLLMFVCGGAFFMTAGLNFLPAYKKTSVSNHEKGMPWENFSPERLDEIRRENKPVLVDFTAAWCLTCQVNDRVAFQNERVVEYFRQSGIVALKADWTNHDEEITQALAGYGKNSIPVYVFYTPGAKQPVFLPEILTPEITLQQLKKYLNPSQQ